MMTEKELDAIEQKEFPKTWAFHHRPWTQQQIDIMKFTGEWYENKDDDDDYEEEDEEH